MRIDAFKKWHVQILIFNTSKLNVFSGDKYLTANNYLFKVLIIIYFIYHFMAVT